MAKKWRPEDWGNLFDEPERSACEAGASAMLSALIKWMEEPCKRHHNYVVASRSVCSQCMAELKGKNSEERR